MRNAWTAKNDEIADLKQQLLEIREGELLKPFIRDNFLEKLGTLLAYQPMKTWPHEAKLAFEHAARECPTLAALYKARNQDLNSPH